MEINAGRQYQGIRLLLKPEQIVTLILSASSYLCGVCRSLSVNSSKINTCLLNCGELIQLELSYKLPHFCMGNCVEDILFISVHQFFHSSEQLPNVLHKWSLKLLGVPAGVCISQTSFLPHETIGLLIFLN